MEEKFMLLALDLAKKAQKKDEVPIGAVIVREGKVIAKAFNLMEKKQSATSHAEIIAINKACKKLKSWRLLDCEMYVTLEPCSMCAGALINSRIKKLYIGADDNKTGACGSVLNLLGDYKFNHTIEVKKYILKEDSEKLLKEFFKFLRERNKSDKKSF